jgi:hypothetical protein
MDLNSLVVHASVRTGQDFLRLRKFGVHVCRGGSAISGHGANPSVREVVMRSAGMFFCTRSKRIVLFPWFTVVQAEARSSLEDLRDGGST